MRKFLNLFFLISVFILQSVQSSAQYNEIGVILGMSAYKGELSRSLFSTNFIHPAGGVFFRHNWNRNWSYRFGLNFGKVSGDDSKSDVQHEVNRNLSFSSAIVEGYWKFEFNFLPFETGGNGYNFTPYIHSGLALFHFNPKAELNGETYELQPLGTEGQGTNGKKHYKRTKLSLPIGGGLKINAGPIGIGIEVTARKAYTDYVDDVSTVYPDLNLLASNNGSIAAELSDRSVFRSDTAVVYSVYPGKQRGDSERKDWYMFAGITVYLRLGSLAKDSCLPFKKRRYH